MARLLDAQTAESERGYSLFYVPENSPALGLLRTVWDFSKDGVMKGVLEVTL